MYHPLAFVIAITHIAAAIAVLNGLMVPLGQAKVAAAAVEGIARQPEAKGSIITTMFIGCGLAETSGVYGFVVSLLLLFAAPLISGNFTELMTYVGQVAQ